LAVRAASVFTILIVAVCHINVRRHASKPRAANRASACGTLSNYLRKRSLCRVIYVVLLRRPDATRPLNSSGKGSATEIRFLLCHRSAEYISVMTDRFACRTIGWPLYNENEMLMPFSAFLNRMFLAKSYI